MITLFLVVMMFVIFFKILGFAIKAAWGIGKIIFSIIILPIILIGLIFAGLIYLIVPIFVIAGIVMICNELFGKKKSEI